MDGLIHNPIIAKEDVRHNIKLGRVYIMGIIKHTRLFNYLGQLIENSKEEDSEKKKEIKGEISFTLDVLLNSKTLTSTEFNMLTTLLDN